MKAEHAANCPCYLYLLEEDPQPGDFSICVRCREVRFLDEHVTMRRAHVVDLIWLEERLQSSFAVPLPRILCPYWHCRRR
jgi:hypothetical protein